MAAGEELCFSYFGPADQVEEDEWDEQVGYAFCPPIDITNIPHHSRRTRTQCMQSADVVLKIAGERCGCNMKKNWVSLSRPYE